MHKNPNSSVLYTVTLDDYRQYKALRNCLTSSEGGLSGTGLSGGRLSGGGLSGGGLSLTGGG